MRRLLTLCALALLLVSSFSVVGCDGESCKQLKAQLKNLKGDIERLAQQRRDADAKGEDMGSALELHQQEINARNNFAAIKAKYEGQGCVERTGEAPSLPPMEQFGETQFE
jgi:hypothetical protein